MVNDEMVPFTWAKGQKKRDAYRRVRQVVEADTTGAAIFEKMKFVFEVCAWTPLTPDT